MTVVDLFAGPGGWSEGLRMLGVREVGVEWCADACATARAAGHERVQADIAALDPVTFAAERGGTVEGLIASPPCQAWSMAGKGGGRRDVEHVVACSLELAAGNDTRAEHAGRCEDERSILVVEALRWAVALNPTWIAFEQVPPVLELWTLYARLLERRGYSTWVGVLSSERFGVPQTRRRAILMAHRDRLVQPPMPTHQAFVPGEPQRHDITLGGEVLPWVSMAEALGWGGGVVNTRGDRQTPGGNEFRVDRPSWALTEKTRSWEFRSDPQANAAWRALDEPAPTIKGGHELPAWVTKRPATTVQGDPRIAPAGHHENQMKDAVRVTTQEAAILQSFRPDYPWQGSRTAQYQQIGNAVPPLLARAILAELVPPIAHIDKEAA